MDRLPDGAVCGPLHLRQPEIASVAVDAIRYGQDQLNDYRLHACVVMANHIHVLLTAWSSSPRSPFSETLYCAPGESDPRFDRQPSWQDESYDHLVRDQAKYTVSQIRSRILGHYFED